MMIARVVEVVVPDPTFINRLAAVLLASAAGVAAGGALAVSRLHLMDALHGEDKDVDHPWAYLRARLGFAIAFGLLAWRLASNPVVNASDWVFVVFTLATILSASGYVELTYVGIKRRLRKTKERA